MNMLEFEDELLCVLSRSAKKELERINILDSAKAKKVAAWLVETYATQNHFSIYSPEVIQTNASAILSDPDYRDFVLNLSVKFAVQYRALASTYSNINERYFEEGVGIESDLLINSLVCHCNEWGNHFDDSMLNEEVSSQLEVNKLWVYRLLKNNHWYLVFILMMLRIDVLEFAKELSFLQPQPE